MDLFEENMDTYSKAEEAVVHDLQQSGWKPEDILHHQKISANGRLVELDLVLLYNLFPVAIVEIKSPISDLDESTFQIWEYAELADVAFGLLSDGIQIVKINRQGQISQISKFPSPEELLTEAGLDFNQNDPLLFPIQPTQETTKFHHAKAISNSIHDLKKNKRVALVLPVGSGKNYVTVQIVLKLIRSRFFTRALIACETVRQTMELKEIFSENTEEVPVISGNVDPKARKAERDIVICTLPFLINDNSSLKLEQGYDFVVLNGEFNSKLINSITSYFPDSAILTISSSEKSLRPPEEFETSFLYSLQDAVLAEDVRIPNGYKSVSLEAVSEIFMGTVPVSKTRDEEGQEIVALSGRSLTVSGQINFDESKIVVANIKRRIIKIQPNDILLTRVSSNRVKIGIVPNDHKGDISIAHSLLLIRANPILVNPKDVYDFLISPSGQLNLIRYASVLGTSVYQISISQLAKMPILIPESWAGRVDQKSMELGLASQAKEIIEKDILPLFDKLSVSDKEEIGQEVEYEYIAEKLRSVALKLSPKKLRDKILTQYPMPIAMSYRRFLDSKFNPYEQILRLRDLFESASFFIYNISLADTLRRLDTSKYVIKDAGARRAFNGYSMARRIDFVDEILQIGFQENNKDDLFVPDLLDAGLVSQFRDLGEFRNLISHTAVATESKQKKLIEKYRPSIESILDAMEFVSDYRLVRIPEFKFMNGRLIRRMEIYAGVVPELEEFPMPGETEFIKAESDHLVLLDQEDQVLDLFPFYQLLASEETHDETHMCFMKQRKADQKKLTGESVQGSFEVILDGYDIFEDLQKRLN